MIPLRIAVKPAQGVSELIPGPCTKQTLVLVGLYVSEGKIGLL